MNLSKDKVWKAKINTDKGSPGTTLNDKLLIGCKDMSLQILENSKEGKNKLSTGSFLIGNKFKKGEKIILKKVKNYNDD